VGTLVVALRLVVEATRATTRVPTQPITTPAPTGTRDLLPKKPIPERGSGDPGNRPRPSPIQERKEDEVTIAVHPGSGGAHKCWPVPCFAETIKQLWEHSCNVLILIGPADHARWAELQKLLPAPPMPAMLKIMIDMPLTAVAEQVQQCRCYLGNDAGITHLAALLGVPTSVLFGPSDPAIWQPVGPSVEIMQAEAFEGLPVIIVIESILRRLNK
jgi:ADP-heptose:LPS heptosyltransferase